MAAETTKAQNPAEPVRRKRSTGFPVISLDEMKTVLETAGKYGISHKAEAWAGYLGHKTTNSGRYKQKIAAMRDFGLLEGRGDAFAISDLGKRIAMPTTAAEQRNALRDAFLSSDVFKRVYEDSAKGVALDSVSLGNVAVRNYGVSPASRDEFIASFGGSAMAASLATRDDDGRLTLLPMESADSGSESEADGGDRESQDELEYGDVSQPPTQRPDASVVFKQDWPIDGGKITVSISTSNRLPIGSYELLGAVATALEELATSLTTAQEAADDPAAE